MQNLLAKSVAVALLVGGFAVTGDLGVLAERGRRVLGAADVPGPREPGTDSRLPGAGLPVSDPAGGVSGRPFADGPPPRPEPADELGRPVPKPPAGGPERLAWSSLTTGSRVVIWLAGPSPACLVLDFVDPAAGEALLYEVATFSPSGQPLASRCPPRRVIAGRDAEGRPHADGLVRGGMLHVAPVAASGRGSGRWLGPLTAVELPGDAAPPAESLSPAPRNR